MASLPKNGVNGVDSLLETKLKKLAHSSSFNSTMSDENNIDEGVEGVVSTNNDKDAFGPAALSLKKSAMQTKALKALLAELDENVDYLQEQMVLKTRSIEIKASKETLRHAIGVTSEFEVARAVGKWFKRRGIRESFSFKIWTATIKIIIHYARP